MNSKHEFTETQRLHIHTQPKGDPQLGFTGAARLRLSEMTEEQAEACLAQRAAEEAALAKLPGTKKPKARKSR
jgi:hypothetical protein